MKYAWIDAQRADYALPDMCEVLGVSAAAIARGAAAAPRTRAA